MNKTDKGSATPWRVLEQETGSHGIESANGPIVALCNNLYDAHRIVDSVNSTITSDLLQACIQARAALPDAWSAVHCNVPVEVIDLLNKVIAKAESCGIEPPSKKVTTWDYHQHGAHVFYLIGDWRYAAANGDTILGYQEWVEHNLECTLHDTDLEGVDAIEVAGCTEADGIVEVVDEQDTVDFYSIYTHTPDQGVECICDFNTKGQAIEFAKSLAARTGIPVYGNLCSIDQTNERGTP